MYNKTGNYSFPVATAVSRGQILTLSSSDLTFELESGSAPFFVALTDGTADLPCAALSVSSAPGGAEVLAVAGTYTRGAAVYTDGSGNATADSTSGNVLGYYVGETTTLSSTALVQIVFA